jgi:hypothetical protein
MDTIDREVRAFAQRFEAHFKDRLARKRIIQSGELQSNFRTEVAKQGDGYSISVYFNQYGRIIDQFAYRKVFKYREESKILKRPQSYKWWRNEFQKVFQGFVSDMTQHYMDETLNKFFQALDFNNSIFA